MSYLWFDMSVDLLNHKSFTSSIKSLVLSLLFFTFGTDSKIQMLLLLIATDTGFVSLALFTITDLWLHLFGFVTSDFPSLC